MKRKQEGSKNKLGWLNPYQISLDRIVKKVISQNGEPLNDDEWQQLLNEVSTQYESRMDAIALQAKQDYEEMKYRFETHDNVELIDEMEGVIDEVGNVPVMLRINENKPKRKPLTSQEKDHLFDILGKKCSMCSKEVDLQFHHINGDRSDNKVTNMQVLCYTCHKKLHKQEGHFKSRKRQNKK